MTLIQRGAEIQEGHYPEGNGSCWARRWVRLWHGWGRWKVGLAVRNNTESQEKSALSMKDFL